MVFSSITFLFLFLPVVLGIYFLTPTRLKNHVLLVASLIFYAWGEKVFVIVMLVSILLNYASALLIERYRERKRDRLVLIVSLVANLGLLIAFKYANFLADNVNVVLRMVGAATITLQSIHLPIGISFFTFHAISYVVDVYRKEVKADPSPAGIALYITLFSQLVAGPILRYHDVAGQIAKRMVGLDDFAEGVRRFIIGFGKKMLIANTLAVPADAIFGLPPGTLTIGMAWLGAICYALQLYFDFSGYSDMAIGLGRMFGFKFNENFNYPYISQSVTEFWRRWHISLSTWFRDYLYIPLGGNRYGAARTYGNLIFVFFICGLWHGASWSFIVWGLFHGALLVVERLGLNDWLKRSWPMVRHAYLVLAVLVGWVFFRAENLSHAVGYLSAMFGLAPVVATTSKLALYLNAEVAVMLVVGVIASTPVFPAVRAQVAAGRWKELAANQPLIAGAQLALYLSIFSLSVLWLASGTHNPFIYFRF
jgi:alginate O-acetyltransferase complex protein AlgI